MSILTLCRFADFVFHLKKYIENYDSCFDSNAKCGLKYLFEAYFEIGLFVVVFRM